MKSKVQGPTSNVGLWLAVVFMIISAVVLPAQERPGQGRGGGSGGIVSNQVIVATVANLYTNNTPHVIQAIGEIGTTTAGTLLANVTNSSGVRYRNFQQNVATAGATTNQISFTVPPGGWWKYGSVTTTLADGAQTLVYYATNGSVTYASSAGSASTATTATTADNLATNANLELIEGGWTANFRTNNGFVGSNYSISFWPTTPATLPGRGVGIRIGTSENADDLMNFWLNTLHDIAPSSAGSELQWTVAGDIAWSPGYQAGKIGHIQKGIGGSNPRSGISATYNPWEYGNYNVTFEYEPGYSWASCFQVQQMGGNTKYPGFLSRAWTNDVLGFGGHWELSGLKDLNVTTASDGSANYDIWAISNVHSGFGYQVYTNGAIEGFYHRGNFVQSQESLAAAATAVALDFGKSASVVITPIGGVSFYTTNMLGLSSNFQRMVFFIRPTGIAVTNITYPTWNVPTNITLPSSLPADYYMRLTLESTGMGESNKYVAGLDVGVDRTFVWDTDATNWFARASVTNAVEMAAINTLVVELKAANAWTNLGVLYIPLKDVAALNGENLKGNTFDITWGGSPAHTNNGVGFNGTSSYANTTFNPTSNGFWSQNSALMALWCGSTTIDDFDIMCGAASGGTPERAYFTRIGSAANVSFYGFNNAVGNGSISASSNYQGLMVGNRTAATTMTFSIRSTVSGNEGTTTTGNINQPLYIGALNELGGPVAHAAINFRLFAAGTGMDSTKLAAFKTAVNKCGIALGWPGTF